MSLTLSGSIHDVFQALAQRESDALICLPIAEIARDCSISTRTVERKVKSLRALRLIETSRPCKGVPHSYTVRTARR